MKMRSMWKRGLAGIASLLVIIPAILSPLGGITALAANNSPRVATPSEGMASMDKIVYTANAVEYGADPTGNNNSTDAIQQALWDVYNQQGGIVFLPAGKYKVEGTLRIPQATTLRGEWVNPDEGGLGKGTILMAYAGKGSEDLNNSFIQMDGSGCLRDISIWYPEQSATNVSVYPPTIKGSNHTDVINVTLYNSYYGFYNNSCSSMLIRGLYGTVLYRGVHGAYAYDIPRIENVYFDTKYWANSGLAGAPSGDALNSLNTYAENNLVAIQAGEQDWGYWYNLNVNHAKWGIYLTAVIDDPGNKVVPGNIAAGKVITRNTKIGVYMENVGYPGFQLTYSDIEATEYGMYYPPKPDYDALYGDVMSNETDEEGNPKPVRVSYYDNATIVISTTSFKGGKAGFWSDKTGGYNINFNDCTFQGWSDYAIRLQDGSLTLSNSKFLENKQTIRFNTDVDQAVMLGNSFASANPVSGTGWTANDSRIIRDDDSTDIPHTPDYEYNYISDVKPATDAIFNVLDYGAIAGNDTRNPPAADSSVAIQKALNDAAKAGGGTVYVPAGVYRMNGGVTVPTGVELRGSFESAHYGNSTRRGSHLYAYGDKDRLNGTPLITLEKGAGVKGFSVFYPEQGYTDKPTVESDRVHAYPPTVRANQDTWVQNMAITACYTAVDAMSNNCDNIVITDVTGAALYASLEMGHGTNGGYVQNLHFNYSGWVQQGGYPTQPTGDDNDINTKNGLLIEYATRVVKGIILGDVKNVNFFSSFNILVAEQIVLEKDPYTGGDFEGVMWGVAFDAAMNGVVGRNGSNADLAIVASMGVFNRQGGGYNIVTKPGFTGRVALYNADAWDERSNLVYVEGGTVDLVQFFSWCVHRGVCKKGGTLNVYASSMVSNNGDNSGTTPDYTYEEGAMGRAIGNLDCKQKLNIITQNGSMVDKRLNAIEREGSTSSDTQALVFSNFINQDKSITNESTDKSQNKILETSWVVADGYNNNTGADMSGSSPSNLQLQMTITLTKTNNDVSDAEAYRSARLFVVSAGDNTNSQRYWASNALNLKTGTNTIRVTLDTGRAGNSDLNFGAINRVRFYIDSINNYTGTFTMKIRDVRIVDLSASSTNAVTYRVQLGSMVNDQLSGDALATYTEQSVATYNAAFTAARAALDNQSTPANTLLEHILVLNEIEDVLVKREPVASASLRDTLKTALYAIRSNSALSLYTSASVRAYKALYTTARGVYNDVFATNAQVQEQINILATADNLLEETTEEYITLIGDARTSNVSHYMNVVQEFTSPVDLTPYGDRTLDIRVRLRVNKDDASFPEAVKSFDATRWITYVRNGGLALWSGGTNNDFRHWVNNDLDCAVEGKVLYELNNVAKTVEFTLPVPAAVVSAGRIDKFELYLYNDLHNFMKEQGDPNNRDNYTEQNTGSSGLSVTVEGVELVMSAGEHANRTALELALQQAATITDTGIYTPATKKAFEDALALANQVMENDGAGQTQVDAACETLNAAIYGLVKLANKDNLNAAIAEADKVDLALYTPATATPFKAALQTAKEVAADAETSQAQVDTALINLTNAKEGLEISLNRNALKSAIDAAKKLDVSDYYSLTLPAFTQALAEANRVYALTVTSQDEIDNATAALKEATNNLVTLDAALDAAIDAAGEVDKTLYTAESLTPFNTALAAAKRLTIQSNPDAAKVEEAIRNLQEAQNALVPLTDGLRDALQEKVDTYRKADLTGYTDDSVAALDAALDAAEDVLANHAASIADLEKATKDLDAAYAGLKDAVDVVYGDLTGEGAVTVEDALIVLQAITGKVTLTDEEKVAANVDGSVDDGDPTITVEDALLILQYITGKRPTFPVESK